MQIAIIGNSAAALSALRHFRSIDRVSQITLISAEPGIAYSRVLLPYYLRRKIPYDNLFIRQLEDYAKLDVKTEFGVRVRQVDTESSTLTLDDDRTIGFDRLLIATGSRPFLPPIEGLAGPNVFHLWTLDDTEQLDPLLKEGRRALVIGSGFIALQAAWAAQQRGLRVTILELLPRIMPTVLDEKAAAILHQKVEEHGVEVRVGIQTDAVERRGNGMLVVQSKGYPTLEVDLIIVGAGVRPNTELLDGTPILTDRGIPVNEHMETNVPGIYAAGDVVRGPTVFGETHQTHALWPTAVEHGRVAGANLAGRSGLYRGSLNMNVTEMFGITVASMGKFIAREGLISQIIDEAGQSRYVKIVLREGIPTGAIALGSAEETAMLGRLRPWIRNHRRLPDVVGFLEGRYLLPRQVA